MSARCVARVPASTYKREPARCEKKRTRRVYGLVLCLPHEKKAQRGGLEIWAPALERRTR